MSIKPLHIVSVIVAVKCKNKYLLVQRAINDDIFPGKWQNAGGKVELGETVEEAAYRELAEETGISTNAPLQFVMSYSWQKDKAAPSRLGLIFTLQLSGTIKDYPIKLDSELQNYQWVTLAEAKQLDLIGPKSPTGTYGQRKKAKDIAK